MSHAELVVATSRSGLPHIVVHGIKRRPVVIIIHSPIRARTTFVRRVWGSLSPGKQRYVLQRLTGLEVQSRCVLRCSVVINTGVMRT